MTEDTIVAKNELKSDIARYHNSAAKMLEFGKRSISEEGRLHFLGAANYFGNLIHKAENKIKELGNEQ